MKRFLSCFLVAASLAPAAHAIFIENFDGDTFPSYWRYDPVAGGKVDWRMGGGVATAVQMIGRPEAVMTTPFRVHDGGDFLFRARAGWDKSPDTGFDFVLGNGPYIHAIMYTEVRNGVRIVGGFNDYGGFVIKNVSDGWHDFEIEQTGGSLRFALDGTEYFRVDSDRAPSMGFQFAVHNKDLEPFPPMYFDRLEVVPEPASLATLALGVGLLSVRLKAEGRHATAVTAPVYFKAYLKDFTTGNWVRIGPVPAAQTTTSDAEYESVITTTEEPDLSKFVSSITGQIVAKVVMESDDDFGSAKWDLVEVGMSY